LPEIQIMPLHVPPGACDCHVHIFGPPERYPLARDRAYTPPEASIEGLLALQKRLGFERVVIVQPSVYGTENSCTLDALRRLGPRARGVAVIDSSTPDEELEKMKGAGVRGVRVNLQTGGGGPALIEEAAARAAALGWHVQTFARIALLRRLKPLPVPLVVDHFGLPESMEDVRYLALLLRQGNSYVKLSGPHRLRMDPGSVVRALLEANPERCVWGSDWPHPFTRGARDPSTVQPFDPIDDAAALERLHGWVGDAALFRKILVDNPARLYDF
jgi:predicted TIM-barrel fold metal-dependent hydrolase